MSAANLETRTISILGIQVPFIAGTTMLPLVLLVFGLLSLRPTEILMVERDSLPSTGEWIMVKGRGDGFGGWAVEVLLLLLSVALTLFPLAVWQQQSKAGVFELNASWVTNLNFPAAAITALVFLRLSIVLAHTRWARAIAL